MIQLEGSHNEIRGYGQYHYSEGPDEQEGFELLLAPDNLRLRLENLWCRCLL